VGKNVENKIDKNKFFNIPTLKRTKMLKINFTLANFNTLGMQIKIRSCVKINVQSMKSTLSKRLL
jgi:hypothetical protein